MQYLYVLITINIKVYGISNIYHNSIIHWRKREGERYYKYVSMKSMCNMNVCFSYINPFTL